VPALVEDNNQFAFELYAYLAKEEGNLFLSPSSISTALAMTYAGARGQTAQEMANTLHVARFFPPSTLHAAYAHLLRGWKGEGQKRKYQLSVANALWGQKGFGFLSEFLDLTRKDYGAGLVEVDFANNTELARKTINDWVERQTQDKIKELFRKGMLDDSTRLVLTNAIYFKGDWAVQFLPSNTVAKEFHMMTERQVKMPFMHRTGAYRYLDNDSLQALDLPYEGKDLSMIVFLPRKVEGLSALEKSLSRDRLQEWLGKMHEQNVAVALPKFKLTTEFTLNKVLAAMGMPTAFTRGADFTGMNGSGPRLFLSVVVHKAFVEVNEEGTVAAAGTGVGVKAVSAPRPPAEFRADHPFLFLIRDNRSGSILFIGRVSNPPA
jgi:serpin B